MSPFSFYLPTFLINSNKILNIKEIEKIQRHHFDFLRLFHKRYFYNLFTLYDFSRLHSQNT